MTFLKWGLLFLIAFALAFVIIVTFSQPQFRQTASVVLFTYQAKPLALYVYVAAALGLGLVVGCSIAAYYYLTLRTALFKRDRRIKKLEEDLGIAQSLHGNDAPQQSLAPSDE